MKIVFLTTKLDFAAQGGSTIELDLKIRALQELGHEVMLITAFSQNNRGKLPTTYHIIQERIGTSGQLVIQTGAYRLLKKYEKDADIFHVDGTVFLYGPGLYRLLGGAVPVLVHVNREQSSFPVSRRVPDEKLSFVDTLKHVRARTRYFLEHTFGVFLANHSDLFTFTAPQLQEQYNAFGVDRKKSTVIRDFFDAGNAVTKSDEELRRLAEARGLPKAIYRVLCSGRMVWEKSLDLIIKAAAELFHDNKKEILFTLSGSGPEEDVLKALAQDVGVEPIVQFPGWVPKEKLLELFSETDVFILPRWRPELPSLLLYEALSYGLPCLVPAGSTLAWSAGDSVLTFEDQNPKDLAKQIVALCENASLRVDLSQKAFRHMRGLHYKETAQELNKAMQKLIL